MKNGGVAVELWVTVKTFGSPTAGITLDPEADTGACLARGTELVVEVASWLKADTTGNGLGAGKGDGPLGPWELAEILRGKEVKLVYESDA